MITIREPQMALFRRARSDVFVREMVDYIASEYPKHFDELGADGTFAFVERSMVAAGSLHIRIQGAVGVFTELRLIFGENFERTPDREWALNILAHPRLPDFVKVEAVQNRLMEKLDGRVLIAFPGNG